MEQPGARYKTLRDEIAIAAMGSVLVNKVRLFESAKNREQVCRETYKWADTMLEASNSTASQTPTTNS